MLNVSAPVRARHKGHLTSRLRSLYLLHPTRRLSHPLQRQLNRCCHSPRPGGNTRTPPLGTCQCHRAATCHSRASWCSSHYRSRNGKEKTVSVAVQMCFFVRKPQTSSSTRRPDTSRASFITDRITCILSAIYSSFFSTSYFGIRIF